jgi:hypothetical protein
MRKNVYKKQRLLFLLLQLLQQKTICHSQHFTIRSPFELMHLVAGFIGEQQGKLLIVIHVEGDGVLQQQGFKLGVIAHGAKLAISF